MSANSHLFRVVRHLPVGADKEDVLWLEVGVGQLALVEELDGVAHLVGYVPDLVQRVGVVVVLLL